MQWSLGSQVHVWLVDLADQWNYRHLSALLSVAESARADRLRLLRQQQRCIVARGALRLILSLYLRQHPASLSFLYNKAGKPALTVNDLQFNLSHSGDLMLLVLASEQQLGVDLEQQRPSYNQRLAKRLLSDREYLQLQSLAVIDQAKYFYKIWTAKEALTKAQGTVFSFALATVTVPINDCWPLTGNLKTINWYVQFLELLPQYQTAIVSDTKFSQYVFWQFTPAGIKQWRSSIKASLMPFYQQA
jgi:4'-phosphopantetheinyl transferase